VLIQPKVRRRKEQKRGGGRECPVTPPIPGREGETGGKDIWPLFCIRYAGRGPPGKLDLTEENDTLHRHQGRGGYQNVRE